MPEFHNAPDEDFDREGAPSYAEGEDFVGEEISAEHCVRILGELTEKELAECSLVFQYVSPEQESIVLFCQNNISEELFFLVMSGEDEVRRLNLPGTLQELSGEARKIYRMLPYDYQDQISDRYTYLKQTGQAASTAEKRARGRGGKKADGGRPGGMHRRHKHKVMIERPESE